MDRDRSAGLRPYLIPALGFAAIAGGIRDVGGGLRGILTYSRAAYPIPETFQLTFGLGLLIIGLGSVAIGYRAVRNPAVVPLTMLSIMLAFLAWQIVVYAGAVLLQPAVSWNVVTTATRLYAGLSIISLVGAFFLFRLLRRWLEQFRRVPESAVR